MRDTKRMRVRRGWSQRKLAGRAHLAFRTVQRLEKGDLDPRLSTVGKLGSALGHSPQAIARALDRCIGGPEDSLRSVSERIVDEGGRRWKLHLASFIDAFRRSPDPRLVEDPPDRDLAPRLRALLTSTAEALCDRHRIPAPDWCRGIPAVGEPWFVAGMESLKAIALVESPPHFRKRNVFVLENFLERV
jgi:transcriptional regulator with XRE-family HTH domain